MKRRQRAGTFLILGSGVTGLVMATVLAQRSAQVVVHRLRETGTRASHFAGGMLAPWCESMESGPDLPALAAHAIAWWQQHVPGVVQQGSLVVVHPRDTPELERFARRTTQHDRLDAHGIARLEPDLAGRFNSALYFAGEAHLDPRLALLALEARLREAGVVFREQDGIGDLADSPATVVDCRGYAAAPDWVDLRGVRGEMLLLRCPEITLRRPVRLLHPRMPLYIVPRDDGRFMIGATMVEGADRRAMTLRSAVELLSAAYSVHPTFAEAEILEMGVGIRPALPDNMPDLVWHDGVLRLNGMYRHGFLMAPALAERAASELGWTKEEAV